MAAYRKKPVVIEAEQFFYDGPRVHGVFYPSVSEDGRTYIGDAFVITVHDQRVYLENGDWVIAEPDGEHYYPCKPDIFVDRYELVKQAHTLTADFEHFLSYSGFGESEPPTTIAKLKQAFEAAGG